MPMKRKPFRKFNGQNYSEWSSHDSKKAAQQEAKIQRKQYGYKAQVRKSGKKWKTFRSLHKKK